MEIAVDSTMNRMDDASAEGRVQSLLLGTWLPVAAIARLANIPTKTALAILQRRQHDWMLDCARVRIDGHNAVHLFRRANRRTVMVMGVTMPAGPDTEAEEG